MNLQQSKSQPKLHGTKHKFLKRFNSKLNLSLFDLQNDKSDGNVMRTIPQLEEEKGYGPPTFRMPIMNNYLMHITVIEEKLQQRQELIQQLQRQIQVKSNQFQKLKKNYDYVKQSNTTLQTQNSQLILKNMQLQQENQMLSKKLSILDLEFKYKISINEQKLKEIINGGSVRKQHKYKIKSAQPTIMTKETSSVNKEMSTSDSMVEIINCQSSWENPQKSQPSRSNSYKKHCRFKSYQTPQRITQELSQKNTKHYQHFVGEIESLRMTIVEYQEKQVSLKNEVQQLEGKRKTDGDIIENLSDQISLKDLLMEEKTQLLRKKVQESNEKKLEIQKLNQALATLQESNAKTKSFYQGEVQNLQKQVAQLIQLIEEEKTKSLDELLKMAELISVMQDEKNCLHSELTIMKIQSQNKDLQLLSSQNAIKTLQQQQNLITSQLQSLRQYKIKATELELTLNEKQMLIQQKNKSLKELSLELQDCQNDRNKLSEEVEQVLAKLSQHEILIEKLMKQLQQKCSQMEDLQQSLQHKDLEMHRMTDELTQKIVLTEKLSQQAQLKSSQVIQELTQNLKHSQQSALKAQQSHKTELDNFKRQCQKVVLSFSSQLQNANKKISKLQQQNSRLNDLTEIQHGQLEQRNKEIDRLRQQIEQHKQHFQQQKASIQEQMLNRLKSIQFQHHQSLTKLTITHQSLLLEKQSHWKSQMQALHQESQHTIDQLELKVKQLEQKIKFMQDENKIKQEEIINLINQKNSIIQNKSTAIVEKDQLISQLKKSVIMNE